MGTSFAAATPPEASTAAPSLPEGSRLQRGGVRATAPAAPAPPAPAAQANAAASRRRRPRSRRRTSAASSDGEIDWSWVAQEAARLEASSSAPSAPAASPATLRRLDPAFSPSAPPSDEQEAEVSLEPVVSPDSAPEASATPGQRASAWQRASMRRVQPFRFDESTSRVRSAPPSGREAAPLPPLGAQVVPSLEMTRPLSSGSGPGRALPDFPRRYSAAPGLTAAPAVSACSTPRHHRHRRHSRSSSSSSDSDTTTTTTTAAATTTLADSAPTTTNPPAASAGDTRTTSAPPPSSNTTHNRSCNERSQCLEEVQSPLGSWPHNLSSMLAGIGCTLGLFNISRFAIFSIQFGANFILQFLFLTLVLGIPLYTFHTSVGQFLASGVVDMWKISPVFQGIGIALLVSQALIGIYSIVGVSWMFVYFRDSFITKQDRYRWAEPFELYHYDPIPGTENGSKLEDTVPDYLSGVVLQRHGLANSENSFGHLKFQVTFNLAVVWMIVFVCLSKGLKSYGKVVYVFSLFPVFGMLILCTKLLGLTPSTGSGQVFPETIWHEFFLNSKSWIAATTEVFFTWGLLGAAIMQISSHNRHKHLLQRDVSLVIILTIAILLLSAFLANTCVQLLSAHGYSYIPSSFENMGTYRFLLPGGVNIHVKSKPVQYLAHTSLICGVRVLLEDNTVQESGYQVLRLATELVPSTFALLGADQVSPFWAVLFYFVLILFGIAQQLAIWHCVITGIMAINATHLKSWETTITFFSCACGFILGLPMTTEFGISVVYFMDYTIGCGWWLMILYLLEIAAIFVIRGRPYSGENVVTTLLNRGTGCLQVWAAPMLVFTWNVILPVALMVICITIFKQGKFRELYNWTNGRNEYWPLWSREIGCLIQLSPVIAVPIVCIIQTCRYLSRGPPDIFDRIQLLYRPNLEQEELEEQIQPQDTLPPTTPTNISNTNTQGNSSPEMQFEDPPPKYTPPPSYTSATGARIAKLLRQSFRRSMRRISSAIGDNSEGIRNLSRGTSRGRASIAPPPDYAAVLVEINQALEQRDQSIRSPTNISINIDQGCVRTNSQHIPSIAGLSSNSRALGDNRMSTLTAADVAHILRSSLRRTLHQGAGRRDGNEHLVHGAVPINQDTSQSQIKSDENNTSVI